MRVAGGDERAVLLPETLCLALSASPFFLTLHTVCNDNVPIGPQQCPQRFHPLEKGWVETVGPLAEIIIVTIEVWMVDADDLPQSLHLFVPVPPHVAFADLAYRQCLIERDG